MAGGAIFSSIDPNTTSGTQLATILNDFKDAVVAGFCTNGGSRPANLAAGGYWIDQQNNPIWTYYLYDGTDDIEVFVINTTTNTVSIGSIGDGLDIIKSSDDSLGAILELIKKRATGSGQTLDGDTIGQVDFTGTTDDPVNEIMAQIKVISTDNVTTGAHGSYMTISTTPDGGATLTERMRFQADGKIGIGTTTADHKLHVKGTSSTGNIENEVAEDSATGPRMILNKKRIASSGQTAASDDIGTVEYTGTDQNGDDAILGKVIVKATETSQSTQHGSEMILQTVEDGGTALVDQVKINNLGNVEVAGDLDINGTGTSNFAGSVTVEGAFTVNGPTTTVNTATLDVEDANITINKNGTQATADAQDSGITVEMSDATDAVIGYDSTLASKFSIGEVGSLKEIADVSSTQTFTNKIRTGGEVRTPSRLDVKQDTFANLTTYALTAADGQICFATDTLKYYGVEGNLLSDLGGGGAGGDAATIHLIAAQELTDISDVDLTGNNADFDGGGTITASSLTLSETAADLIKGTKVISYVPAADGSGDYFGFTKDVPKGLRGRSLGFSFEFKNDSTTVDDDFRFSVKQKDGANAGAIEYFDMPAFNNTNDNSTLFFIASAISGDCTDVETGWQNTSTTTTVELHVDNFLISTDAFTYANLNQMTAWEDYTPTTQGLGSPTITKARYRQSGDNYEIDLKIVVGSSTASEAQVSLPNSKTVDSTHVPSIMSAGHMMSDIQNNAQNIALITGGDSFINFGIKTTGIDALTPQNGNAIFSSGDILSLVLRIPITGLFAVVPHVITPQTANESMIRVNTCSANGSGNTRIPYFTNLISTKGTAITRASNSTDGDSYTINEPGVYHLSLTYQQTDAGFSGGISLNSTQLTTSITSITAADRLCYAGEGDASRANTTSVSVFLNIGDIVRAHAGGTPTGGDLNQFTITKIGFATLSAVPIEKIMYLQEEQIANTNGSNSSTSYATMVLNATHGDTEVATLSGNEFTVQKGKYEIDWSSPGCSTQANKIDAHISRLYNVTTSAEVMLGSSEFTRTTSGGEIIQTRSLGSMVVEVGSATTYRVERKAAVGAISGGFGLAGNLDTEVYGKVKIRTLK